MLRHSWNGPAFDAPSPKNDTATPPLPSICAARPRAGDDRDAAGDDAVGAEHADREIGDVHRAALALAITGLPAVELGHHAVQIGALGDAMAMAAMGRDDAVGPGQCRADADRDRFLADIAMHDAVDLAGEVIGRGALLEMADRQHPAQHLALLLGWQVRRDTLGHRRHPSGPVLVSVMMGHRRPAGNRVVSHASGIDRRMFDRAYCVRCLDRARYRRVRSRRREPQE